ncbi:histidine phosphatase family protein [Saccharopolyspora sp. TS4A08]|uniref:Histidine phosphatase family protein n=1 Tax=Saccharopolyspora ipomoeae TaxID=3042027 RepID=A0ABT6PLD9_9PSEU|nr:histidine phosphatase family protein [Saccharopolyspora sp. TS4A08]MDI2028810.1 histidine phosphatase family protein [Saccharopolyspora sp. TS4A08]
MEQRVYILRHGTTEWSLTGQHTSRTDIPLTAEGELRARQAGQTLTALRPPGPVLVLCSPRKRAQRTADLAGLADVVTEPLLVEWDYGDYEGLTTDQIRETVPDWTVWSHPCPGGETASNVATRADDLLTRVRGAGTDVVLVGHGHFSRCLIARWLNLPIAAGVHFALDPAAVTVLGDDRGAPQIQRANVPAWQHG